MQLGADANSRPWCPEKNIHQGKGDELNDFVELAMYNANMVSGVHSKHDMHRHEMISWRENVEPNAVTPFVAMNGENMRKDNFDLYECWSPDCRSDSTGCSGNPSHLRCLDVDNNFQDPSRLRCLDVDDHFQGKSGNIDRDEIR